MAELMNPDYLLEILEGNRRLSVRAIEAFPEHHLFQYTPVEPLRPFAEMMLEVINLETSYVRGIATGHWEWAEEFAYAQTTQNLLAACAEVRSRTLALWPQVTVERLLAVEPDPFFSGPPQPNLERIWYALENEIHHRGQGYINLRMLGLEPPIFYER